MTEIITLDTPIRKLVALEYDRFKIKDIKVSLNSSATIVVLIYPVDGTENSVICKNITMTTEEYNLWGTDDSYVIEFIKNKLLE